MGTISSQGSEKLPVVCIVLHLDTVCSLSDVYQQPLLCGGLGGLVELWRCVFELPLVIQPVLSPPFNWQSGQIKSHRHRK